jgi:hypothetical protein
MHCNLQNLLPIDSVAVFLIKPIATNSHEITFYRIWNSIPTVGYTILLMQFPFILKQMQLSMILMSISSQEMVPLYSTGHIHGKSEYKGQFYEHEHVYMKNSSVEKIITPSDSYYSLLIRMYLSLKYV